MTHPAAVSAAVPPRARVAATAPAALEVPLARRVLGQALLLGVAADALLRPAPTGLGLPAWIALAALAMISLTWSAGRRLTGETATWLLVAIVFALTIAWRDAGLLQFGGVVTTWGALLMAAVSLHNPAAALLAPRVRDLLWESLTRVRTGVAGLLPFAWGEAAEPGEGARAGRRAVPALRAAAIAVTLLVIFGGLLRGADPIFASLVTLPALDMGDVVSHVLLAGLFAWLAAGWTRAALDQRAPSAVPAAPAWSLGTLEVTTALGALDALFALYVLAQLGWFFGGERFLHERTGLTAAEYARSGFFQVVWVVLLVVPLLLATRAMLAPGRALARRHTLLALPLVGLLGAIILSAASRMRLYVHYYGLTEERFYTMAFLAWLAVLLLWLALTVLRGRGERFVAGALVSGLVALLALDIAAPDVIVARVNIARAAVATPGTDRQLDLGHLATLGGEAVPLAVGATLAPARSLPGTPARADEDRARCRASSMLIERWGPESARAAQRRAEGAWRSWNAGQATALDAVASNVRALRTAQHDACAAARASSPLTPKAAT